MLLSDARFSGGGDASAKVQRHSGPTFFRSMNLRTFDQRSSRFVCLPSPTHHPAHNMHIIYRPRLRDGRSNAGRHDLRARLGRLHRQIKRIRDLLAAKQGPLLHISAMHLTLSVTCLIGLCLPTARPTPSSRSASCSTRPALCA